MGTAIKQVIIDNKINRINWTNFLLDNKFASPFHSPDFYDLYNSIPGQYAKVYAILGNNDIESLCVVTIQKENGFKSYFSRRAIIYGGPLFEINNQEACLKLLQVINNDLKRKVIYIETRNSFNYSSFQPSFSKKGWNYIPYLNFQISLIEQTAEGLIKNMKYNRRREINLSLKEGASYRVADNITQVITLYSLLAEQYITRIKIPLPSIEYFSLLYHSILGKVFIVEHENKIIGGSFCMFLPGGSIYTLYYCGLRHYHQNIFPTHLSIMAAIEFGIKNNLKLCDLMGAGKVNEEYGVRKFKSEFGGDLVEHGRFIKIFNPLLYKMGKIGLKFMKVSKFN